MKKILTTISIFVFATCSSVAQKQILPVEELPKAEAYLPNPPSLTDPLYFNDYVQYQQGKEIRNTERGQLAIEDAEISPAYYMKRFGEVMGKTLTPATHPNMALFIKTTYTTVRKSLESAKDYYHRLRPFVQFNEDSGLPEDQDPNLYYQSYPSGHTVRAWAIAMALVCVDPAHQNEILKVGYEMGQSRVILGYHYQSDVEAARLAASGVFARICTAPEWVELLEKAKTELNSHIEVKKE